MKLGSLLKRLRNYIFEPESSSKDINLRDYLLRNDFKEVTNHHECAYTCIKRVMEDNYLGIHFLFMLNQIEVYRMTMLKKARPHIYDKQYYTFEQWGSVVDYIRENGGLR